MARDRWIHLVFIDSTKAYDIVSVWKLLQVGENTAIDVEFFIAIQPFYGEDLVLSSVYKKFTGQPYTPCISLTTNSSCQQHWWLNRKVEVGANIMKTKYICVRGGNDNLTLENEKLTQHVLNTYIEGQMWTKRANRKTNRWNNNKREGSNWGNDLYILFQNDLNTRL